MIKAVSLDSVMFDVERDLLTPTFKKKRPQLLKHYQVSGVVRTVTRCAQCDPSFSFPTSASGALPCRQRLMQCMLHYVRQPSSNSVFAGLSVSYNAEAHFILLKTVEGNNWLSFVAVRHWL